MAGNVRFITVVGTLLVLVAVFLGLLLYFSNNAFRSVQVEPEQVFGRSIPADFYAHSAYQTDQGAILELADSASGVSLSLVRSARLSQNVTEQKSAILAFEQVRAYRMGLDAPEEILTPFSVRYASAHFDTRRAKLGQEYLINIGDKGLEFISFRVGRDLYFHLAVTRDDSSDQVLILLMRKGNDFDGALTAEILKRLRLFEWIGIKGTPMATQQ